MRLSVPTLGVYGASSLPSSSSSSPSSPLGDSTALRPALRRGGPSGYAMAVMTVTVAGLLNWLLWDFIRPQGGPLFILAVVVAASYGGRGPGVVAAVLATLARATFYQEPVLVPLIEPRDLLLAPVFLVTALIVSWATSARDADSGLRGSVRGFRPAPARDRAAVDEMAPRRPAATTTTTTAAATNRTTTAAVTRLALRHLLTVLMSINLLLLAAYVACHTRFSPSGRMRELFMMNGEANVVAWWSGIELFLCGLAALLLAHVSRVVNGVGGWLYLAMGLGLIFLSVDEIAIVHEHLSVVLYQRLRGGGTMTGWGSAWDVLVFGAYALAVLLVPLVLLRDARRFLRDRRGRGWMIAAAMSAAAAVAVDLFGDDFLPLAVEVGIEEFLELAAWALLCHGLICRTDGLLLALTTSRTPAPARIPSAEVPPPVAPPRTQLRPVRGGRPAARSWGGIAARRAGATAAWRDVPALVRAFFVVDVLLVVLYVVSRFGPASQLLPKSLSAYFDLNKEYNLPSWYAAGQLFLIGVLLAVFAGVQVVRRQGVGWAVALAGAAFLFLSLDEATALHESFTLWLEPWHNGRQSTPFHVTGLWMLICAPLFVATVALLGLAARRLFAGRARIVWLYLAAITVFVFSAAVVEGVSNFAPQYSRLWRLLVLLEEAGEMLGATMMLWATLELLRSHGARFLMLRAT